MEKASLAIEGMTCGNCIAHVGRTLRTLPGVTAEAVELGKATVSFDPALIAADAIEKALTEDGYPAHIVSSTPGA